MLAPNPKPRPFPDNPSGACKMIRTRQQKRKKLIHALALITGVGWGGFASPLGAGFDDDDDDGEGLAVEEGESRG